MDSALFTALRLSKAGFGTPDQILRMPVSVVLGALQYVTFLSDYEATFVELNKQ